jgi:predicted enzyme related to lactoylglutathione lyase
MDKTKITGINMASVYAVDYEESFRFYNGLLGLGDSSPMGKKSCYFPIGGQGMYLVGGYSSAPENDKAIRTTFTFEVASAIEMFKKLKDAGVKVIQHEPMEMTDDPKKIFWFQCYDPSGNIVEFLGEE